VNVRSRSLIVAALTIAVAGLAASAAAASFAGKNGRIYFASNLEPTGFFTDIFSMRPNGTDLEPVRMLADWQQGPTLSPNGRWIAFFSEPEISGGEYLAMTIRGKKLRPIADAPSFTRGGTEVWPSVDPGIGSFNPAYSSDGTRMAWRQDDGTEEDPDFNIWAARTDGGDPRQLTDHPGNEGPPDFAPNGRRLAYATTTTNSGFDIFDVRFTGKNTRRLTHGERGQFAPDYSPDGRKIVFMAGHGENPDIFRMSANGKNEHPVTNRFGIIAEPDWGRRPRR